jgi:hypothetical protein
VTHQRKKRNLQFWEERKINNMSMKEKFKIDRLKYEKSLISKYGDGLRTYSHGTYSEYPYTPGSNTQIRLK